MTSPSSTWREKAPTRNITVHRGEDIDIAGRFQRDGQPWIPPTGTTAWFRIWNAGTLTDHACTIIDGTFALHIEAPVADALADGTPWWFYVQTPDTPNGNPKVITIGQVRRVDPA